MITRLAKWWLEREGWTVEQRPYFCLDVSGGALAISQNDERTVWSVSFPSPPWLIARNHSLITDRAKDFVGGIP